MARFEDVPLVKDFMETRVHTANEGDDVLEAARALLEAGHSGAPVLDGDGKLVGLVTRRDVLQALDTRLRKIDQGERHSTYDGISKRR